MAELVAEGKVRYLGLSEVDDVAAAAGARGAPDHGRAERVLAVDPRRGDGGAGAWPNWASAWCPTRRSVGDS